MTLKESDEFADFGFVRWEFMSVLGDLNEPVGIPRLFYFRKQEIQFDKIDVLDFVGTALDELPR